MKYNFYGWEAATVKPINNIYPSIHSPRDLYNVKPISKSALCPCRSGKKYKRCCGKDIFFSIAKRSKMFYNIIG